MRDDSVDKPSLLQAAFDALPTVLLVVDRQMRIQRVNRAAEELVGPEPAVVLRDMGGDLLRCLHSAKGCGGGPECRTCVLRNTVQSIRPGQSVVRRRYTLLRDAEDGPAEVHYMVTASVIEDDGHEAILVVLEDVTELLELHGLIAMCSNCRRVRNDDAYWEQVDDYLRRHSHLRFSHGLCPDCTTKLYPETAM